MTEAQRLEDSGRPVWQLDGSRHTLKELAVRHGYLAEPGEEPKYWLYGSSSPRLAEFTRYRTLGSARRFLENLEPSPTLFPVMEGSAELETHYRYVYVFRLDRWLAEYRCPICGREQDRVEDCRCLVRCNEAGCREFILRDGPNRVSETYSGWRTIAWCDEHLRRCPECSNVVDRLWPQLEEGGSLCGQCSEVCANCDSFGHPDCDEDAGDGEFDYRNPAMVFLGCRCTQNQQDEKCDGLHLGIELETDNYNEVSYESVHDWAAESLGRRNRAMLKEDGSVRGFELVCSPMTPEFFRAVDWESLYGLGSSDFRVSRRSGLHVHVDQRVFQHPTTGKMRWAWVLAFIKLLDSDYGWSLSGRSESQRHEGYAVQFSRGEALRVVRDRSRSLRDRGSYVIRYKSINLNALDSHRTIEVRMFGSPASARKLRDRVGLVIDAVRFIQHLSHSGRSVVVGTKDLSEFQEYRASLAQA